MRRAAIVILSAAVLALAAGAAIAKPPKGAVRGIFSKSLALGDSNLIRLLSASNVYCLWNNALTPRTPLDGTWPVRRLAVGTGRTAFLTTEPGLARTTAASASGSAEG